MTPTSSTFHRSGGRPSIKMQMTGMNSARLGVPQALSASSLVEITLVVEVILKHRPLGMLQALLGMTDRPLGMLQALLGMTKAMVAIHIGVLRVLNGALDGTLSGILSCALVTRFE